MNTRRIVLLCSLFAQVIVMPVFAGSGTWKANPASGDWNTAANWSPATVPDGASDTATFASSNLINVSLSSSVEVNGVTFANNASAFTITVASPSTLTISGNGIANTSAKTQTFTATAPVGATHDAEILFTNGATAGSGTLFVNSGPTVGQAGFGNKGFTEFADTSTAGNATFTNKGGGLTLFTGSSSAANGTFVTKRNGGTNIAGTATAGQGNFTIESGGQTSFFDSATAEHGVFTVNDGSMTFFSNSTAGSGTFTLNGGTIFFDNFSDAGNATLTATDSAKGGAGGSIRFDQHSAGGTARVIILGTGELDVSAHTGSVAVGSIEGDGSVLLGSKNLIVGGNKINATFSGVIDDGGAGGSLTVKMQRRILFLTGPSTYTGGTTIKSGRLSVSNQTGSGTGTGPVQVNGGSRSSLNGNGTIFGPVTIGDGKGVAVLNPQSPQVNTGTLTIKNTLTFNPMAEYLWVATSGNGIADSVVAAGVTINSNVTFFTADTTNVKLPKGTVFTAIQNTSSAPIAGTFSNLADGGTFTVGLNKYKANYEGGTGNDLTLTVQ